MSLFPKVLWPFSYLTLTLNKPSEFFKCYLLFDHYFLIVIELQYMPCIPMQIKPNKSPLRKRFLTILLLEIGHLFSPCRSCLGRLILICGGWGGPVGGAPPQFDGVFKKQNKRKKIKKFF